MKKHSPLWKTGCLYPVTALKDSQSGDLYLNREALSGLSPELNALVTGELTGPGLESQWEKGPLVAFLSGHQADHQGRWLNDILALEDFWLEHTHDYIQWLFPIDTPSRANLNAPMLSEADRAWFRRDPYLRFQHRRALGRMLSFCGLHRLGDIIEPLDNLHPNQHIWLKRGGLKLIMGKLKRAVLRRASYGVGEPFSQIRWNMVFSLFFNAKKAAGAAFFQHC